VAIFEAGMIENSMALAQEGWIDPPYLFSFVLGLKGALPATAKNLLFLSEIVPPGSMWCAVGHDLSMSVLAMGMGGHARTGFEDSVTYRPGERATSNAQLIERLARIAREIGCEVATPGEARALLGLSGG